MDREKKVRMKAIKEGKVMKKRICNYIKNKITWINIISKITLQ